MFAADTDSAAPPPADVQDILDHISRSSTHGGMELRGNGNVFLWVTPEEEAEVRKGLEDTYRATVRRTDWRISFGTVPAADAPAGGLVARADADALAARLAGAHTLAITSMNGQRVRADTDQERSLLSDADVVSGHLDPHVESLATGRSAELAACGGFRFTWLGFHLAWTEPLPDGPPVEARNLGGRAQNDSTVTLKKDETGPVTATVSAAETGVARGESLALAQPAVWTWQPRGECYLPKSTALVLVAEHPAGRAVIVCEEITP
jgi:hypothetical protein